MTASNFPNVLPVTLQFEGGLSMVRSDPGNWTGGRVGVGELKGTYKGIAASAHPKLDIPHLTDDEVSQIYETEYWRPSGAVNEPNGLDLMVFDASVMSGVGEGKRLLAAACAKAHDTIGQIHAFADARLSFVKRLKTFRTFGGGWTRRVAACEAKAVRMAAGPSQAPVALKVASVEQKSKQLAKTQSTAAATVSTAAMGSGGVAGGHEWMAYATAALVVLSVVIGGYLAWQHSVRARALAAEAAA